MASPYWLPIPILAYPLDFWQKIFAAGEACGIQRQESWSDETYRSVLLRKLKLNTWDGTNETVEACLEAWETLTDTGGNNVTVQTTGTLPLPVQELLPVPVGVAVVRY